MKYRKKPVVIEAEQFTEESFWDCEDNKKRFWGKFDILGSHNHVTRTIICVYINIETLEGTMKANLNDWIIKGVSGEYYPCKPDIFEKTYEKAEEGCD
jgi:hypothetical protein